MDLAALHVPLLGGMDLRFGEQQLRPLADIGKRTVVCRQQSVRVILCLYSGRRRE